MNEAVPFRLWYILASMMKQFRSVDQHLSTFINNVSMFEQEGRSNNVIMDVRATNNIQVIVARI